MESRLPEAPVGDEASHLRAFLSYFRSTAVEKCSALSPADRRRSRLPSGWSPLELLLHVAAVEQRWVVWGFLGERVAEPWPDSDGDPDGPWRLPAGVGLDEVLALLGTTAARTDEVLATTPLSTVAAMGGRFDADPPDLRWIAFHVLQEWARHTGHLDVAVELTGGPLGE